MWQQNNLYGQPNGANWNNQQQWNTGNYNQGGFNQNAQQQQQQLNPQRQKESQIQELKKNYPNANYQRNTSNPSPIDIIELTLPMKNMQIPITLMLDESYPITHPRILIRGRIKHPLFEEGPNGIEIQVTSFMQWDSKFTLVYTLLALKNFFEQNPPTQEKIIEEVNNLLAGVLEQDFKNLVTTDVNAYFKAKSNQELREYAQAVSYQEIIASSNEYQKIANNLLQVAAFNEKTSGEIMQKSDAIKNRKQKAVELVQKIEQLKQEFVNTQSQCKSVSDRFNLQEVGRAVEEEIMRIEKLTNDLDESASYGKGTPTGSIDDMIQIYFESRKKYHHFNIIREKLPSISPN